MAISRNDCMLTFGEVFETSLTAWNFFNIHFAILLHGRSKQSGWSGFAPTTFSQTQLTHAYIESKITVTFFPQKLSTYGNAVSRFVPFTATSQWLFLH